LSLGTPSLPNIFLLRLSIKCSSPSFCNMSGKNGKCRNWGHEELQPERRCPTVRMLNSLSMAV
jgi:hypothetical protein